MTELPELILRARGTAARFRRDAVLLDQGKVRRRIPVQAIEKVRATGPQRRTAEIVLTAADRPGTVYAVTHSSAEAVAAFAAAVNAAVPKRDSQEPRGDGDALVEVLRSGSEPDQAAEPSETSTGEALLGLATLAGLLVYVAGLVVLIVISDAEHAVRWGIGILPLGLAAGALHEAWTHIRDGRVLRRRGVSVIGTFHRFEQKSEDEKVDVYRFIDAEGVVREHTGKGRPVDPDDSLRVEITYDPQNPELTSTRSWAARVAGGSALCLGGVVALALGLYYCVPGALVEVLLSR